MVLILRNAPKVHNLGLLPEQLQIVLLLLNLLRLGLSKIERSSLFPIRRVHLRDWFGRRTKIRATGELALLVPVVHADISVKVRNALRRSQTGLLRIKGQAIALSK